MISSLYIEKIHFLFILSIGTLGVDSLYRASFTGHLPAILECRGSSKNA